MARLQDFQNVTPTSSDKILIVQSQGQGLAPHTIKLDSANPTGTGKLSINRRSGSSEGEQSIAVGSLVTASGNYSHAEGRETTASGNNGSHAEGYQSTASGDRSHAEGSNTTASGNSAHTEGVGCIASGGRSHAEGNATIANHYAQHVFGSCNVADTSTAAATERGNYIEIVGKGTNDANRSNARTLDWSGNEVLAGGLKINVNQDVQAMVQLENITANTEKTYTIPNTIYSNSGVYILAVGNIFGEGVIYLLKVAYSSNPPHINLIPLATTNFFTVASVSANQFKITSGNAIGYPSLTRIA